MRWFAAMCGGAIVGLAVVIVMAVAPPMEERMSNVEGTLGICYDCETSTVVATATDVPPTATATTPAPTATEVPAPSAWHAPTDHEHGDAPPAWAESWSLAQFGHGVVYGGDEQTSHEDGFKHNAFKGYSWTTVADDGQLIDIYLRLHMQTNPLGRSAQYHSYELYMGRAGEVLYFTQGWLNFGPSSAHRNTYADASIFQLVPLYAPANHIVGSHPGGNSFYNPAYSGEEFWYAQQSTPNGHDPVVIVDVFDPSTYMMVGESTEVVDWLPTGDYGVDRRVLIRFIVEGSPLQTVSGQPYLSRNMTNPRGWFCADVHGAILSMGAACAAGELAQYIDPAMPSIGDTGGAAVYRNQWTCLECELPN